MDDSRIDSIAREVLTTLRKSRGAGEADSAPSPRSPLPLHPSEALFATRGGVPGEPCLLDAGQVCVGSLRCRSLGH